MMSKGARYFLSLLVFTAFGIVCSFGMKAQNPSQQRVVAVGDIHGAYDDFVGLLQQARLIDSQKQWTGGNSTFVQLGDVLDRGPESRAAMDLLMDLEKKAPRNGGRAVPLAGNHEIMNLIGDLRYVSAEEYASYAQADSDKKRDVAYKEYVDFKKRRAEKLKQPSPVFTPEAAELWKNQHPPGFLEHRQAFGPDGKYGKWLRNRDAIAEINGMIFLHGGIHPSLAEMKIKQMNERIRNEIRTFDHLKWELVRQRAILPYFNLQEILEAAKEEVGTAKALDASSEYVKKLENLLAFGSWLIANQDGPLWFRGYAEWTDEEGGPQIDKLLAAFGVTRFVVAHTPQTDGRIRTRFGGKVFLIDTGMLSSYYPGGRASALEIQGGKFTAIYKGEESVSLSP